MGKNNRNILSQFNNNFIEVDVSKRYSSIINFK